MVQLAAQVKTDETVVMDLGIPEISVAQMEFNNNWYRNKTPVKLPLGMVSLKPEILTDYAPVNFSEKYSKTFSLKLGDASLGFQVEKEFVETLVHALNHEITIDALSDSDLLLLLELVLTPALEALEAKTSSRLVLTSNTETISADPLNSAVFFINLHELDKQYRCRLIIPDKDFSFWAELHGQREQGDLVKTSALETLVPVSLALNSRTIEIDLKSLYSLDHGDVILLGAKKTGQENLLLSAGGVPLWTARRTEDGSGVQITGPGSDVVAKTDFTVFDESKRMNDKNEDADIGEIPLNVVFEVGRKEVSVKELRNLQEGSIVSFPQDNTEEVHIVINGKKVGWGELVRIGETIGVRVERIFANGG